MNTTPESYIPRLTPGHKEENWPVPPVPFDLSLPDRCVAVIGGRGSGKSTLLRHLAAKGALILDDTTPEEASALADANPDTRIFATAGLRYIPGFTSRELLPFTEGDVSVFLSRHVSRDILWDIVSHRDLGTLAETPAIAAEIAGMCRRGMRLPAQRAELYEWVTTHFGLVDHPAMHRYRACTEATNPPAEREEFCLYGAIRHRNTIDELATTLLASSRATLPARANAIARLQALEADLNRRITAPDYRDALLGMTALFEDTPESAAVPLPDKLGAAEALARLGDPRLRLPADPAYWAPVGQGIELGRFPVTVYEFEAFVQATGYLPYKWAEQRNHPSRPVTGVGWHTAVKYCRWAGGHLPTAAEWESALAGKYPWGDREPDKTYANTNELQLGHPTPVGLFPRGNTPQTAIADLYGNVFEWVDEDVTRPGEIEMKATRGASSRSYLASPNGRWDTLEGALDNIGFRCARKR